jgi:hypothetical protein
VVDAKVELYRTDRQRDDWQEVSRYIFKKYKTAKKYKSVIVKGRGAYNNSRVKRRALE